jgi:hypothetical protein
MNAQTQKLAIPTLRWTVGLVVLFESCRFVLSHGPINGGLPLWIRPVLGGGEIIASILFLVPFTRVAGGNLLLVIFAFAIFIHILHGQYDVGALLVYAATVGATMSLKDAARGQRLIRQREQIRRREQTESLPRVSTHSCQEGKLGGT